MELLKLELSAETKFGDFLPKKCVHALYLYMHIYTQISLPKTEIHKLIADSNLFILN